MPRPERKTDRRLTVEVGILYDRGLWMKYCQATGMNEWAPNEGQVGDRELLPITESQAIEIGLLR